MQWFHLALISAEKNSIPLSVDKVQMSESEPGGFFCPFR